MNRYDISLHVDPSPSKDFSHFEVYRAPELPIIAVNTTAKTFTIEGRFASWYDIGDDLEVTLSTGNDKDYTVASVTETAGNTVITVSESIPSSTADGLIKQKLLKQLAIKSTSTSFVDKGLPTGFYYYVIYAVDKNDNYSDPSNIIIKTAPESIAAPAQPTGLNVVRSPDLLTVEIFWNANREEDLKGYVIYRSFDGLSYHATAVVGATANNYKDTKIPPKQDTDSSTTPVIYTITAFNKAFIESTPAGPTFPMAVPIVTGLRAIIEHLSLNVYWNYNRPEDGITSYEIVSRAIGNPWVTKGTVMHPQVSFRIEGPFVKNTTYEIGIIVHTHTGTTDYVQPLPIPVTFPDYEEDTTPPHAPEFLEVDLDPQFNRMFMSWRRSKIDDDFLQYQVWWARPFAIVGVDTTLKFFFISGHHSGYFSVGDYIHVKGSTGNDWKYTVVSVNIAYFPDRTRIEVQEVIPSSTADGDIIKHILDGTTNQNNWTFRNFRKYFTRETLPADRAFILAITAIDRSGNQSLLPADSTASLTEYWMSQDMVGPEWIDVVRNIPDSFFNNLIGGSYKPGYEAQFYMQWNDSARAAKFFRRYILYESVLVDPRTGVPIFDFNDVKQIRTHSTDNTHIMYNHYARRGLRTTDYQRTLLKAYAAINTFVVNTFQEGHFKVGNKLVVYGSTVGNDGTYTIVKVADNTSGFIATDIEVAEPITASEDPASGYCYDSDLNGTKWYTVLAEDWFGDVYHALPNYPWIEVK